MGRRIGDLQYRKVFVWLMAAMVFLVVLASSFYMAAEAEHICEGEGCPVCECREQCEHFLQQLNTDGTVFLAACVFAAAILFCALLVSLVLSSPTLVSYKVRLDS